MLEGKAAVQRDLDRLEEWVHEIQQRFRQSPAPGKEETLVMIKSGDALAREQLCCKDGQQCKHESAVHPSILGCIKRPVIIGWSERAMRGAEETRLVQSGEEMSFRGPNSSIPISMRRSSRK